MMGRLAASLAVLFLASGSFAAPGPAEQGELKWFKGNLHTHSLWSDGDDFPEMIGEWYRDHGYQFLALSDHNTLSRGAKWIKFTEIRRRGAIDGFYKYLRRFGDQVDTRGALTLYTTFEVRLKTYEEVRRIVERPGFLMIQAEEVTDKLDKLPVHMGAINVDDPIKPRGGKTVREIIANNLHAIQEQSTTTRPVLPHLNHPNFGWGVTAEDLAAVVDEHFFEIYNGHPEVHQAGDKTHPSVERIWDIANTIRVSQLKSPPLMGLGSDDSHHYHIVGMSRSSPGRGWIQVRAKELTAKALVDAITAGDFYASSGVTLADVRFNKQTKTIELEIEPDGDAVFTTRFVGTPVDYQRTSATTRDSAGNVLPITPVNSDKVGMVFATSTGLRPTYTLSGKELYVRAIVVSSKAAVNPSMKDQKKQAWTQPVEGK